MSISNYRAMLNHYPHDNELSIEPGTLELRNKIEELLGENIAYFSTNNPKLSPSDIELVRTGFRDLMNCQLNASIRIDIQNLTTIEALEFIFEQKNQKLPDVGIMKKYFGKMIILIDLANACKFHDLYLIDWSRHSPAEYFHFDTISKFISFYEGLSSYDIQELHEALPSYMRDSIVEPRLREIINEINRIKSENPPFGNTINFISKLYDEVKDTWIEENIQSDTHEDLQENLNNELPVDAKAVPDKNYTLERIKNTFSFTELPLCYQELLKFKRSNEISLHVLVFTQLFQFADNLLKSSNFDMKTIGKDLYNLLPIYSYTFNKIIKKIHTSSEFSAIKTVPILVDSIQEFKLALDSVHCTSRDKKLLIEIQNILAQLIDSLKGHGLPIHVYDCLLSNIIERPKSASCVNDIDGCFQQLMSTSLATKNSYTHFYETVIAKMLQNNQINTPIVSIFFTESNLFEKVISAWKNVKKDMAAYHKKIKEYRKKKPSITEWARLYNYTHDKLAPFVALHTLLNGCSEMMMMNVITMNESKVDLNKYKLGLILEKLFNHNNAFFKSKFYSYFSFLEVVKQMKVMQLGLKQDIINIIDVTASNKDLVLNYESSRDLVSELKNMVEALKNFNTTDLDQADIYTYSGKETLQSFFDRLSEGTRLLEITVEEVHTNKNGTTIGHIFVSAFWIRYHLRKVVEAEVNRMAEQAKNIIELFKNIEADRFKFDKQSKYRIMEVESAINKKLSAIEDFVRIFETFCRPCLEAIENFESTFMERQDIIYNANNNNIEDIKFPRNTAPKTSYLNNNPKLYQQQIDHKLSALEKQIRSFSSGQPISKVKLGAAMNDFVKACQLYL